MKLLEGRADRDVRVITRRGLILGAAQIAFVGVLGLRIRQMQIEQVEEFRLLADENRINIRLTRPARGLVFDRNGVPLVRNEHDYGIVLTRADVDDLETTLQRIARIVGLSADEVDQALREISEANPSIPVTVANRLKWDAFAKVAANSPALQGVRPDVTPSRSYPLNTDFAHVLGYVGPVSDYDMTKGYLSDDTDPLLQIPRFQVGKTGVEAKMEHLLRGRAGIRREEVNAVGRVMRQLGEKASEPGANLQLTIDSRLQNYVQVRLGAESASAVVMDIRNGDIMAMGSAPSFDPNKFVRGISVADWNALTANRFRPLSNKATQGVYPPGSTFKMVTALAALHEGVIGSDLEISCGGHVEVGGRRFHCWRRHGHGDVDLHTSLVESCDVFYYDISRRISIEEIASMARRLGFGQHHDLPLSAVHQGLMPDRNWKLRNRGADWVVGDTLNSSIGQGFVLSSPLQLAVMTARIASGKSVMPRLAKSIDGREEPVPEWEQLGIDSRHLDLVRDGMIDVVNKPKGTAYRSRILTEGMLMAGKTGTSQVRGITAAERRTGVIANEDRPWNQVDHALFVCYAPYDAPRIACSVVVEHGGSGSHSAAPIARDIVLQALYGDTPPLSAYPENQRGTIQTRQRQLKLRDPAVLTRKRSRA